LAARAGVERKKRCQVPGARGWGLGPREKQIINTNSRSYGLLPTANCLLPTVLPQSPAPSPCSSAYSLLSSVLPQPRFFNGPAVAGLRTTDHVAANDIPTLFQHAVKTHLQRHYSAKSLMAAPGGAPPPGLTVPSLSQRRLNHQELAHIVGGEHADQLAIMDYG